jgi:hypothetical protein
LRESLGLTTGEYAAWVANPGSLAAIVERHRREQAMATSS